MAYLFDSHTHSWHSHDGQSAVHQMAESAWRSGLAGFCVTDHCDSNLSDSRDFTMQLQNCADEVASAQQAYAGRVDIRFGVELGESFYDIAHAEKMAKSHPYDLVLLALHMPKPWPDLIDIDWPTLPEQTIQQLFSDYFDQLYEGILWGQADVVAHLTLPARYLRRHGLSEDFEPHQEAIDRVLTGIIETGMGLEVNTSGCRRTGETFMPTLDILTRYRQLGGEIVTLGSDAHSADQVGAHLRQGTELLQQAGFRYGAVYRQRTPEFYELNR